MTDRQGIEIDYCPQCRGVWLDRGELDKIIERSTSQSPQSVGAPTRQVVHDQPYGNDDRHGHDAKHSNERYGYQRKKSVWQELFD
jgi:Zn-finger nucleic acid-binding protein